LNWIGRPGKEFLFRLSELFCWLKIQFCLQKLIFGVIGVYFFQMSSKIEVAIRVYGRVRRMIELIVESD